MNKKINKVEVTIKKIDGTVITVKGSQEEVQKIVDSINKPSTFTYNFCTLQHYPSHCLGCKCYQHQPWYPYPYTQPYNPWWLYPTWTVGVGPSGGIFQSVINSPEVKTATNMNPLGHTNCTCPVCVPNKPRFTLTTQQGVVGMGNVNNINTIGTGVMGVGGTTSNVR